ncbi:hypothetical protein DEI92_07315 [Curtobacterium sp. MCBD17_034]|uniref:Fur family transcriptional regulator n=1 Tax=unclassified Curtobacterium TaxID=257496 RepID=UPI000DA6F9F1|nr:hypothetical protein DEI92_07315 [Curtobacterium sp. MCBD17_034]PZF61770.1 hypothetical protein DEI81_10235 [Curtobacterium sp. MCBD17_013]PZM34859.1 hypothetical protein DEI90_05300 [Curtobacterium sp. MCBD17_031]
MQTTARWSVLVTGVVPDCSTDGWCRLVSTEWAGDRPRGHRYRASVLAALVEHDAPASAQSVFARIRARGVRIGLSTVYRELHALARERALTEAYVGGEVLYRLPDRDLLVCDTCGRTSEVADPRQHPGPCLAFFEENAALTIHGRCSACSVRG